jgi:uncharacterized oligopeptide transporter (OPT) family protein
LTFALLTAALSVANVYTTLLTGWGDGGSILSVLAATLVLRTLLKRNLSLTSLNLGQTMASGGGYMGFAVAWYAALVMAEPIYQPGVLPLLLFFVSAGLIGALIGIAVRPWMVRYCFPSGTACAVIQREVTSSAGGDGGVRPIRIMVRWGIIAGLLTIPTKIAVRGNSAALLPSLSLGARGLSVAVDPLLFGIGAMIGPRIGVGLIIGGAFGHILLPGLLTALEIEPALAPQWTTWMAVSLLVVPTAFSIAGSMWFGEKPIVPAGFSPGMTNHPPFPKSLYILLGSPGLLIFLVSAQFLFRLPSWLLLLVLASSVPISLMNGRISGDTDVNPVSQVGAAVLFAFVFLVESAGGGVTALLGLALIAGTIATISVDMMYDFRTGYLLDQNPNPQTWVLFAGIVIGGVTAVPFVLFLHQNFGFGEGGFAAPGPRIYTTMAMDLLRAGSALSGKLIAMIVGVSILGSAYAFLAARPKTGKWMPSLFGVGIGLLLGFEIPAAIFVGSMVRFVVIRVYERGLSSAARAEATEAIEKEVLLAGSSVFAAGALVSVFLVLVVQLLSFLGVDAFQLAH